MGSKSIVAVIIFLIAGFLLIRTVLSLWNTVLPDFVVYHQSIQDILRGDNPYNSIKMPMHFLYPVPALLFFYPLSFLSAQVSMNLWLLFSVFCFVLSVWLLYQIKKISCIVLSIMVLATVVSFPFKFTLGMGQVNLFLLCLLSFFLYYISKKKLFAAGGFLAASVFIKLFPIIFLPYVYYKKQTKVGNNTILWLGGLSLVGLLIFSPAISYYYFTHVGELMSNSPGSVYYNQSLTGALARLSFSPLLIFIIRIVWVLFSGFVLWNKKYTFIEGFSLLLILTLLVNTITWQHHLVVLLIPFYFLITKKNNWKDLIILVLSYILLAWNIKNPSVYAHALGGNLYLSHQTLGMVLLWGIYIVHMWRGTHEYKTK